MKGQLWQECFCRTEPVCVECERCKQHCACPQRDQDTAAFNTANPGLLQKIAEHHEQGAREH